MSSNVKKMQTKIYPLGQGHNNIKHFTNALQTAKYTADLHKIFKIKRYGYLFFTQSKAGSTIKFIHTKNRVELINSTIGFSTYI